MDPTTHPTTALLVARDPGVVDAVRRAAGEGAGLAVVDGPPSERGWSSAALVLVHDQLVADDAVGRSLGALPRRDGVVLVTGSADDPGVWDVAARLGAERVVVLPDALQWLATTLSATGDTAARVPRAGGTGAPAPRVERSGQDRPAHVVGVLGGCGGAGASVFAGALASRAARRGIPTTLVDLDPVGAGADLVLGVEGVDGLRWDGLSRVRGRTDGSAVRRLLPGADRLAVLARGVGSGPDAPAVAAVVGGLADVPGLVVLDLPRAAGLPDGGGEGGGDGGGDARDGGVGCDVGVGAEAAVSAPGRSPGRAALALCDEVVLVCPDDPMSVAAAARLVPGLAAVPASVVVRTESRVTRRGGDAGGWVPELLGLPLTLVVPSDPAVQAAVARGEGLAGGRGALARGVDALLDRLSARLGSAGAA